MVNHGLPTKMTHVCKSSDIHAILPEEDVKRNSSLLTEAEYIEAVLAASIGLLRVKGQIESNMGSTKNP